MAANAGRGAGRPREGSIVPSLPIHRRTTAKHRAEVMRQNTSLAEVGLHVVTGTSSRRESIRARRHPLIGVLSGWSNVLNVCWKDTTSQEGHYIPGKTLHPENYTTSREGHYMPGRTQHPRKDITSGELHYIPGRTLHAWKDTTSQERHYIRRITLHPWKDTTSQEAHYIPGKT